jgi:hypothetical protein
MICSSCSEKDKCGCEGCLSDSSGDCEIKVCCENKGIPHCGMCSDFPCDLLRNTSFDESDGDDGERILNCKKWADEANSRKYFYKKSIIEGALSGLVSGAIIGSLTGSLAIWIPVGIFLGVAVAVMIIAAKNG